MAAFLANGIKVTLFNLWRASLNALNLRLFQNNITPNGTETNVTFQEATFTGYASQVPTFPLFALNALNEAESNAGTYTFTQTGVAVTNNIFGYYLNDGANNLYFSERDPAAPFAMNATGRIYQVTPDIQGGTATGLT
jgi:hypothetical protein